MQTDINSGILARQRLNYIFKELFRKSIHICSSFVPLFLGLAYWPVIAGLVFLVTAYSICELFRLKGKTIPLISKVTEIAARKRDENKFVLGPVTLVLGILTAALLLPLDCARVGIFALSFGDGLASLGGKFIGRITIPGAHGKTVAGSLTCFTAVFVATFCCSQSCLVSLIVALFAMFIEALPLADFDNLLIPISIGFIYKLLMGL
ncbi:MAG: SEC59/DGK1/VTE5 family protein [Treponema sp.]|nr:SEC59/DGK1/VTE5 family protein [Treponema sp.]